jgi:peptide/nickel transport system substrate-binding protein
MIHYRRLYGIRCLLVAMMCVALLNIQNLAQVAQAQTNDAPAGSITVLVSTLGGEKWFNATTNVPEVIALMPMFESLLYRDVDTGQIVTSEGRIAQSWEVAPDASSYTFRLRDGVQFHDGWGPLTAEDVKFTIERAMSDGSQNGAVSYLKETISRVETPDKLTVIIHLKKPSLALTNYLTEMIPNLGVVSKKYYESVGEDGYNREPIGSGPYKFVSHTPGESITFEAVEDHWRVTPDIKTVKIMAVPDAAARLLLLKAGQADIAPVSYDQMTSVKDSGLEVLSLKNQSLVSVLLTGQYLEPGYSSEETPPWAGSDAVSAYKVRRALSLAINRADIVEYILGGRGSAEQATAFSFVPTNIGFDPAGTTDPYDPEKARQLLAEAGYSDPSDLSITIDLAEHSARPYAAKVLEAVGQMWQQLGINVNTQKSEWSAFVSENSARKTTAAYGFAAPAYDDAAALLAFFSRSTDRSSWTGESEELDSLLNAALAAIEPDKVRATRRELWLHLYETIPAIPVVYADLLFAMNPKLEWEAMPGTIAYTVHNYEYMRLEQ